LPDKIMVVDDEVTMVEATKMVLEGEGYQVISATSGDEALQKADVELPNLILLDLVMPGRTGLETCKILKTQSKTSHIPVIMFTALGRDIDRKLGTEAGADGHFTKPFTPEDLTTEVRKHLDHAMTEGFSKQLGTEHSKLQGKKLLLEFDPSTPYERLIRDFVLECRSHDETIVVLTKKGYAVRQALEGNKGVELVDVTNDLMLSPILEKHCEGSLSLVYDNLTDLALSTNSQTTYQFASNAIERLSDTRITAVFLLNPAAHDPKGTYSLKGLFSSQATYGKQGITNFRIT